MREPRDPLFVAHLTSNTYALALVVRQPLEAIDGLAFQTRSALRREIPHHRLHALELRQLRHPPSGVAYLYKAQSLICICSRAGASSTGRLKELILRYCRLSSKSKNPGTRALRMPCFRIWTSFAAIARTTRAHDPAITFTRWTMPNRWRSTTPARPTLPVPGSKYRSIRPAISELSESTNSVRHELPRKPASPPSIRRPDRLVPWRAWGFLRLERGVPLRAADSADADDPKSNHDFGRNIVPTACRTIGSWRIISAIVCVGITEEPYWRDAHRCLLGKPTWTWWGLRRNSTSMTTNGPSGRTRSSFPRQNSFSTTIIAAAWRWIPRSPAVTSSAARWSAARCCFQMSELTVSPSRKLWPPGPDVEIGA